MKNTAVIILAAGASSRLGFPKQLVEWNGKPLLQGILEEMAQLQVEQKLLVLGAHHEQIRNEIHTADFQIVYNANWKEGMSSSIRIGLQTALSLYPYLDHVLFLLSDQPYVDKELVKEILQASKKSSKSIIACVYKNTIGVPALFSKQHFLALLSLTGDRGAGAYIKKHKDDIQQIEFELGIVDIDTPEDLKRLN